MTFRPSGARLSAFGGIASLTMIGILADGVSMLGRIASWLMLCVAVLAIVFSLRTKVTISQGVVEVQGARPTKLFTSGTVSVLRTAAPLGTGRGESAVHIEGPDGSSITIPLAFFRPADRQEMVAVLRETL